MLRRIFKTTALLVVFALSLAACNSLNTNTYSPYASNDLWSSIRGSFKLRDQSNRPEVQKQIRWFIAHPEYLRLLAKRAGPYLYYIHKQVEKRNMPGELTLLPMIESAYDPFAYSHAGAAGLWQIMPGTGSGFGLKQNWWYDGRRDVYRSTKVALDYLQYLNKFFDGNWNLATAAYDSGEGTVQNAIKRNAKRGKAQDFWALPLPRETQAYVPRLLALATIIRYPGRYPVKLPEIANKPYFVQVDVGSQIDLAHAAKLAGIPLAQLYKLNPGYNRWATAPNGPHTIVLPIENVEQFKTKLAAIPQSQRVTWNRHVVQHGDTLGGIAKHYRTKIALIRQVNHLSGNIINVGKTLLIPRSKSTINHKSILSEQRYMATHKKRVGPRKVIHIVQIGDSLWKVAQKYRVKPTSIQFWNRLAASKPLTVGEQLIIWSPIKFNEPRKNPAKATRVVYHVQKGDNLSKIARKYHVKLSDLKRWNKTTTRKYIRVGQRLTIYPKAVA